MRPGGSGSPGITSSSPVKNRPSRTLRYTGSDATPIDATRPVSCGSRRCPGVSRAGVWPPRAPADIDLIYFDPADLSKESEAAHERRLDGLLPGLPWQVRNQARMHVWKGLPQHKDTPDSMVYWLETVTSVGVRLEEDDSLTVLAPLGTDDLLGLVCRPTAFGRTRRHEYDARIAQKRWAELWPKVRFLD